MFCVQLWKIWFLTSQVHLYSRRNPTDMTGRPNRAYPSSYLSSSGNSGHNYRYHGRCQTVLYIDARYQPNNKLSTNPLCAYMLLTWLDFNANVRWNSRSHCEFCERRKINVKIPHILYIRVKKQRLRLWKCCFFPRETVSWGTLSELHHLTELLAQYSHTTTN